MKTIDVCAVFSYLDDKNGLQESSIDIRCKVDDCNEVVFPTEYDLRKFVARKWKNRGYRTGYIDTVHLLYIF